MEQLLTDFRQFGFSAVAAVMMFLIYRADRKSAEERFESMRKVSEERFAALATEFREIVMENTSAYTKLSGAIERLQQRAGFRH